MIPIIEDVIPKAQFEVIPILKVQSLDESDLEIHENYFLFGENPSQDSDSDIEVLTKPVPLYSKVLKQSLLKDGGKAAAKYEENKDGDKVEKLSIDDEVTDEDDSEIEVIRGSHILDAEIEVTGNSHHVCGDSSLEITFSNNSEDEVKDDEEDEKNINGNNQTSF